MSRLALGELAGDVLQQPELLRRSRAATARSACPSLLKSAAAVETGPSPAAYARGARANEVPAHGVPDRFSTTTTCLGPESAVTRSDAAVRGEVADGQPAPAAPGRQRG